MGSYWIQPTVREQTPCRLWCFPYAGAGASAFHGWSDELEGLTEVRAVQLPGREHRLREPLISDWRELTVALAHAIGPDLDPPYVFYGHSFGGLVAFELARHLIWEGYPPPAALVVGACHPPTRWPRRARPLHKMNDEDLVAAVLAAGETPAAVLQNAELRNLLLPIIRADFKLCETYARSPGPPLDVSAVVLAGETDGEAPPADMGEWKRESTSETRFHVLPGAHLFLRSHRAELLAFMRKELSRLFGPLESKGRSSAIA
jgi:surfactin synthase thioesterase subunit